MFLLCKELIVTVAYFSARERLWKKLCLSSCNKYLKLHARFQVHKAIYDVIKKFSLTWTVLLIIGACLQSATVVLMGVDKSHGVGGECSVILVMERCEGIFLALVSLVGYIGARAEVTQRSPNPTTDRTDRRLWVRPSIIIFSLRPKNR